MNRFYNSQFYISLNKNKENIIKYWPILSTFALLIGGIWQLFSLASISLSYIRFFSVGQLMSDTLLFLWVFTISFFSLIFLKNILAGIVKEYFLKKKIFKLSDSIFIFPLFLIICFFFPVFRNSSLPYLNYLIDLFNPNSFDLIQNIKGFIILIILLVFFGPLTFGILGYIFTLVSSNKKILNLVVNIFSAFITFVFFVMFFFYFWKNNFFS
jgi:hypothetical protein